MPRLDQRLVELGLAPSRARAQALIAEGVVTVDGVAASKPALIPAQSAEIALTADPIPWVSRAALKLLHGLEYFGLTPTGTALDLGASTGGFTEVLLASGAARVHALDVGHGQLHPRLRADSRVTVHERVNSRDLPAGLALPAFNWITADLSFISLTKALPAALSLARPGGVLIALIKQQFELGPHAGQKGIIRDPALHREAQEIVSGFLQTASWTVTGLTESPITGQDGNREFLIAARAGG
ncbi:MAG: TlyA family RNA methyltransferase [Pseudomonadota bacterium]